MVPHQFNELHEKSSQGYFLFLYLNCSLNSFMTFGDRGVSTQITFIRKHYYLQQLALGFDCIGEMQEVVRVELLLGKSHLLRLRPQLHFTLFGLGGLVHRLLGEHKLDLVPHHIGDTNLRESCTGYVLSHLESVNEAGRRVLGQLGLVEAVGVMDDGCLEAGRAPRETGP